MQGIRGPTDKSTAKKHIDNRTATSNKPWGVIQPDSKVCAKNSDFVPQRKPLLCLTRNITKLGHLHTKREKRKKRTSGSRNQQ